MHGETDILQHRIEVAALDRRIGDAQERVRGDQDEQIEGAGDPGLHRQHMGAQRQRQVIAERRDQAAEQRQDRDPQQHRAFMIAPDAGDLVDQRLQRMRILVHVDDGEVGRDVQRHQRRERAQHEHQLRQRGRARDIHQRGIAEPRAKNRHRRLDQRQRQRQHEGIMSGFRDHCVAPMAEPRRGLSGFGGVRLLAVIVFPVSLLLQGVRDILRHVGLVMLGEHGIGPEHAGGIQRALGDHALPFAKQVRQNALVGHRQRGAPSPTLKLTARLSPRTSDPFSTIPPSRNRLPGGMCFSVTITGVEKNTIESRSAFSTSAAAMASTASEPPIMVNRRCLRVMRAPPTA